LEPRPTIVPITPVNKNGSSMAKTLSRIFSPPALIENWEVGAKKDADIQQALRAKDEEIERLRAAVRAAQERR
jgi:hypothetical protein